MSYLALYRRYRPQTFSQVLGQPVITQTLKNQIMSGKFTHAYLFCGSRGTGKTSTAKILARALNCLSPVDGDPCGQCEICRMSDAALSSDIIEIDAASNNGVDEIRDLRDKVRYGPAIAKYKVYIIDEVHMLSSGAFNALLKTLRSRRRTLCSYWRPRNFTGCPRPSYRGASASIFCSLAMKPSYRT